MALNEVVTVTVEHDSWRDQYQVRVRWPDGLELSGDPYDDENMASAEAERVRKALAPLTGAS